MLLPNAVQENVIWERKKKNSYAVARGTARRPAGPDEVARRENLPSGKASTGRIGRDWGPNVP